MKNKYIKSPLNYVGGKYKLLDEIIPLLPRNINTFVDLFGGGFNVGINVNATNIIYNDSKKQVVELLRYLQHNKIEDILNKIDGYIEKYNLTNDNKEGYLTFRSDYNTNIKDPIKFYTLLCYAFNHQIRFNKNGEYNMPFGKDKSSFNPTLRKRFVDFYAAIHNKNISFLNISFKNFCFDKLSKNDLVYCDPPYFNSVATYNENGGWTEEDEEDLLNMLTVLDYNGVKFALSNNLKYNNPILDKWKDGYNIHYLNSNYSNCDYQKIDRSKDIEVLITNY